jgi:hypothetical protein
MAFAEAEMALATRQATPSDWRDFAAWCASRGATALPAHQGIVVVARPRSFKGRKTATELRPATRFGQLRFPHLLAGMPARHRRISQTRAGIRSHPCDFRDGQRAG